MTLPADGQTPYFTAEGITLPIPQPSRRIWRFVSINPVCGFSAYGPAGVGAIDFDVS